MVNTSQIISMVQTSINDLAGERIQTGEYLDHLNFVAMDVAEQTEIYINRHTTVPKPAGVNTVVHAVTVPYTQNTNDLALFRIIKVVRGDGSWTDCMEYSQQTINSGISGTSSFIINKTQLGRNDFMTFIGDPVNGVNGGLTLVFGGEFETGENVVIDFISGRPWGNPNSTDPRALRIWSPNDGNPQAIPDFLRNAFEWGLLYRVSESLYMKGDESYMNKADRAKMNYQTYLRQAVGYSKMLKDNRSAIKMQPVNWLEEDS